MIRQERIDPRTCPAWWKFRLFTRLRRYVCICLAVEAVLTVMTMLRLPWMWNPIAAMVWELMQVGIAGALGWVFGDVTSCCSLVGDLEFAVVAMQALFMRVMQIPKGTWDGDLANSRPISCVEFLR